MKNNENKLLQKTFFSFLKELLIWSLSLVILPMLFLLVGALIRHWDFQWLFDISQVTYNTFTWLFDWVYSGNFLVSFFAFIWVAGDIVLIYRLLKKVLGYVDVISRAANGLLDKGVEYIELPPELEDFEKRMNHLKRESEKNERLAREAEQRKNDLVVYLAHDLKTPLTSVIGYLTLLRDENQISEELREKYLSISLEKAERLEDLINEFFEITRFNLSQLTLEYSRVNLTRLLEQLTYEFKPMLLEKNLECILKIAPDTILKCDVNKMQRVFDNLLRNAVNYSFENGRIYIVVTERDYGIRIQFANRGNTIPKEKLERIFEQFYRLDTARSSRSGGAGLGLAISREIVELHGGTITARSEDEIIQFEVNLPFS